MRNWDALSSSYRGRLERNGITRSAYESGVNVAAARGHAQTPEHPHTGESRPEYRQYHLRREQAERKVVQMKRDKWGMRDRWSDEGAEKSAKRMSMSRLKKLASYDSIDDYMYDMILEEETPDDEADHYHP